MRYVGFLPTVSDKGPAKREPEPTPKRYIAVDRVSVVFPTWKALLASVFAMDSAAPAHAWTNISKDKMAMFLHLDISGQLRGSRGSSSPEMRTNTRSSFGPWMGVGRADANGTAIARSSGSDFPSTSFEGSFFSCRLAFFRLISSFTCWPILLYWTQDHIMRGKEPGCMRT